MNAPLEFEESPRAQLQTWNGVKRLITTSIIVAVIVLGLMAAFLT